MTRPLARRLAGVSLGFAAVAVAATWPLARHLASHLPGDAGDPLLNAWTLGWVADRLRHGLAGLWTAPNFFPYRNTLAFSEHLIGIAVFAAPIAWATGNPLVAYNAAFIASFALAGIGMYLLASSLSGGSRASAWVAGLAFAFAPARWAQISHLQVLMSGWMPLALWALHLYLRTASRRWLAAFTAFALLESLSNSYFAYFLALPGGIVALGGLAAAAGRRLRLAAGLACAAATVALALAPIAAIYFQVRRDYGQHRTEEDVTNFGADLAAYMRGRDRLLDAVNPWLGAVPAAKPVGPEGDLFPGVVAVLLAAAGAAAALGGRDPLFRAGRVYLIVLAAAVWLSMGLHPTAWGVPLPIGRPYALLFEHLPGFDGIRVPARLSVVALIAIDVLAALGVVWLQRTLAPARFAATTAGLVGVLVLEGVAVPLPLAFVAPHGRPAPAADHWVRDHESGAVLDLPVAAAADLLVPFRFQYQSLFHRHRIVGGSSGYDSALNGFVSGPASPLLHAAEFADALRMLRDVGVRTIVVHPGAFADEVTARVTLDGLRAARQQLVRETAVGGELVFALAPVGEQERATRPGSRDVAGRRGIAIEEIPRGDVAADSPLSPERLAYLFDGNLDSRWLSGGPQSGSERLVLRFVDRTRDVALVRIETSPRSIGNYPRHLVIEAVDDNGKAAVVFDGSVLPALGAGLVEDPIREPIELWLPRNRTRTLQLRQTAQTATWFWAIDELKLFEAR